MCQAQKVALFFLVVIVLTLATVLGLYPFLGRSAVGGFGILGFLGLGPLYSFWRHRGQVLADERDQLISRRSTIFASSVFFLTFLASAMLALAVYGENGAVPVMAVMYAVWCGVILFVGTHAVATLVQYGRGGSDARS
jgi:uncharacterized membrane protein